MKTRTQLASENTQHAAAEWSDAAECPIPETATRIEARVDWSGITKSRWDIETFPATEDGYRRALAWAKERAHATHGSYRITALAGTVPLVLLNSGR